MKNTTIEIIKEPSYHARETGEQRLVRYLIRSGITECIRCAKEYYNPNRNLSRHRIREEIQFNKDFLNTAIDFNICVFAGFSSAHKIMEYINTINSMKIRELSGMALSCV